MSTNSLQPLETQLQEHQRLLRIQQPIIVSSTETDFKKFALEYRQRLGLIPKSEAVESEPAKLNNITTKKRMEIKFTAEPVAGYLPKVEGVKISTDRGYINERLNYQLERVGRKVCSHCLQNFENINILVIRYDLQNKKRRKMFHIDCAVKAGIVKKARKSG